MSSVEPTAFETWLGARFAATGDFTALVVLVEISGLAVTPLRSTFFNVIGDEVTWGDIVTMFAGAGGRLGWRRLLCGHGAGRRAARQRDGAAAAAHA